MIERVVRTRGRLFLITAWMTISAAQAAFSQANAPQTISDPQTVNATAKLPEFAVVSVKQNKSGANFAKSGFSPEGIHTENSTLLFIIRGAYGMTSSSECQAGPGPIDTISRRKWIPRISRHCITSGDINGT